MANSVSGHETESHKFNQTVAIISAYVGHNTVKPEALPDLIRAVYSTLKTLTTPQPASTANEPAPVPTTPLSESVAPSLPPTQALSPAVDVKRSVFPDYILCLEDGQKTKMLKPYLRKHFNMSPEEYRARWGLPPEYPMVAPNYSAQRAEIAKRTSLGRHGSGDNAKDREDGTTIRVTRRARATKSK